MAVTMEEICDEFGELNGDSGQVLERSSRAHATSPSNEYNHQIEMSRVDEISKQLEDMKESLIKTSVRCHMLEVDLATQFSPYAVDSLRNVKQECEKCVLQMKLEGFAGCNPKTTKAEEN